MKANNHVRTAIRWRPVNYGREVAIEKVNDNIISVFKHAQFMNFDNVFDSSDQSEVFDVLVKPLIDKAIEGFDFTFLATGQTGSGKTYTMGFERSVNSDNNGIVSRVLSSLFCHENANRFKIQISFVEVYNDQAFDLLSTNPQEAFFTKDPSHRSTEATKMSVQDETEVMTMILNGTMKRRVRRTKMNSVSSRSHAIFTVYLGVEHKRKVKESVINLVDLAGSQGFRKTGNIGEAQTEGKSINEGLSAFKRVINSMVHCDNHIPYRDTVITTLLRSSLNTHSYLTLLGCVSPYQDDYGETLTTLRFVSEAKQIKMSPQMSAAINEYQKSLIKKINKNRILETFKSHWKNIPIRCIRWHPNVFKLAISSIDDRIHIFSRDTETITTLENGHQQCITALAWRPFCVNELAVGCSNGIIIWKLDTSECVHLTSTEHHLISSLEWNRNGSLLVSVSSSDPNAILWDVDTNRNIPLEPIGTPCALAKWSPNNEHLFISSTGSVFLVWHTIKWTPERWTIPTRTGSIQSATWSPCSNHLLFITTNDTILYSLCFAEEQMYTVATPKPIIDFRTIENGHLVIGGIPKSIVWDPTGRFVAVLFKATPSISIFSTSINQNVLSISPNFNISGNDLDESPSFICFKEIYEKHDDIVLTIGWSTGRVQYFPIQYNTFQ